MQKRTYLTALLLSAGLYAGAQRIEIIEGLYYEGRKPFTGFYRDTSGTGMLIQTISLKNGKQDGKTTIFYESGKIKEERYYKNGLRDSIWTTWSESGEKLAVASFRNDLKDGNWIIWDEKGTKRYDMHYRNGEKVGLWKMWDATGKLVQEKAYQ
jgi:antitoxin component YwqK of YwqJK toxin-antitoxin module